MTLSGFQRPTRAVVDLATLSKNVDALSKIIGTKTKILGIVKANGYGHGATEVAQLFSRKGAAGVGVADLSEAFALRDNGYEGYILSLGGFSSKHLNDAASSGIAMTAYSREHFEAISSFRHKKSPLRLHIKVNTGMNRLGFDREDWPSVADHLQKLSSIHIEGIFTHLSESDAPDLRFTQEQLSKFNEATTFFEQAFGRTLIKHAGNSGGALNHPSARLNWVRPGIALYGYPPALDSSVQSQFRPALSLRAPIVQIRKIAAGDSVGYNRAFQAKASLTVATVAIGYGDGVMRDAASVGVGLEGIRCPVLGIICMDLLMIDITQLPQASIGSEVTIFGPAEGGAPDARDLAKAAGTIPYEILTSIAARVRRDYVGKSS